MKRVLAAAVLLAGCTQASAGMGTAQIGDVVTIDGFDVTLERVEDPWRPDNDMLVPAEGDEWVAVDVSATNTGDATDSLDSSRLRMFDGDGRPLPRTPESCPSGTFAPGETIAGTCVWSVPLGTDHLELRISGPDGATRTIVPVRQ